MFVEYQPRIPSIRALKPGARMVFIRVWPVLKSLPVTGTPRSIASCSMQGRSIERFGAPFANGTPLDSAAYT